MKNTAEDERIVDLKVGPERRVGDIYEHATHNAQYRHMLENAVRLLRKRVEGMKRRAESSHRDTHLIECSECDASVLVYVDEPVLDLSAMEPGWRFNSDEGWTCPEHGGKS